MTETDERRAQGAKRVSLETLVEICGNEPGIPAFEAEALDVSGRGMHVRTAYLPELGAPLVCRFEDHGREILVEGVVAWRRESGRGGEFGIQFTALDSGSVDALGQICGPAEPARKSPAEPPPAVPPNDSGARVRLHIDGLGSPMKARVRTPGDRQIQVGSNLEFLKVGRHLDIEDLEHGQKRGARIEGVSVAVDPKSQVPQLVVVLRYDDGPETTPEPSVIDSEAALDQESPAPAFEALRAATKSTPAENTDADEELAEAEPLEDELHEQGAAFRGRIGSLATQAGEKMQGASSQLARFGATAARGMGRFLKGASERLGELKDKRRAADRPRRTTSPPGAIGAERGRLRPQSGHVRGADQAEPNEPRPAKKRRLKSIASAGAAVGLLATVSVIAMQRSGEPPGADPAAAASVSAVSAAASTPSESSTAGKADGGASIASAHGGISADVPLFGPTPMATMEPAALGAVPPPATAAPEGEVPDALEVAANKAQAAADDEAFAENQSPKEKTKASPADVEPWGRGKMHTPIVHRLRLDGPGGAIQGAITPTGFSVVIPERKVMEGGSAIVERDKRIAKVQTKNLGSGAQITFQFRNGVPGYRVRLRKDYVEFLISAADKSASTADAAKKPTKDTSGKAEPKKSASKSTKHKHG